VKIFSWWHNSKKNRCSIIYWQHYAYEWCAPRRPTMNLKHQQSAFRIHHKAPTTRMYTPNQAKHKTSMV